MRVLIFSHGCSGHHLNHARLAIGAFRSEGHQVSLAVIPAWLNTSEYREHIGPLEGQFDPMRWDPELRANGKADWPSVLLGISHLSRSSSVDHLYFPTLDGINAMMGLDRLRLRRAIPIEKTSEAVLLRASRFYPAINALKWATSRGNWWFSGVSPINSFSFMDPVVNGWINADPQRSRRWQVIADPVEATADISKGQARRQLGIPEDGRYIIALGYLDKRKGADLLARSFLQAKLGPKDRLALIGPQEKDLAGLIRNECASQINSGRIIIINRFMTNEEFSWGFSAADVVAATYPRHIGSASMVIRAAAAKRPSIGSTFGWIGRTIKQFDLGWTCDATNIDATARELTNSIENAEGWSYSDRVAAYVRYNSVQNYQAGAVRFTRQHRGLPPHPDQITWNQLEAQTARG